MGYLKYTWNLFERVAPDKLYISVLFKRRLGYRMDWKNPRSFNQKLQWMKLYDRNPAYSELADKVRVRDYVRERIGEQFLIPVLGIYENAEQIDFDSLPNRFVLKCNHGAKYNIICKDKNKFDINKARYQLNAWLQEEFWRKKREYHYKSIVSKIICEQYMEDSVTGGLNDYKVFMIHGEPIMIQVDMDRFGNHTRNVYDAEWNLIDVEISYPKSEAIIPKPMVFDDMVSCAKKLAADFKEVRVDFYLINGRLYFGEMTFFSGAGFSRYNPREFEFELGEKLQLK